MPCYEPDWPGEGKGELRNKVSYLTRLLCENLTLMKKADDSEVADDRNAHMDVINPELQEWWQHHQRLDAILADKTKYVCRICQGDGFIFLRRKKTECSHCNGKGYNSTNPKDIKE